MHETRGAGMAAGADSTLGRCFSEREDGLRVLVRLNCANYALFETRPICGPLTGDDRRLHRVWTY